MATETQAIGIQGIEGDRGVGAEPGISFGVSVAKVGEFSIKIKTSQRELSSI
jgi:hypothetical protein